MEEISLVVGTAITYLVNQSMTTIIALYPCDISSLVMKSTVMYLGCDKDQWRWRSKCISYVVLRVAILEQ